MRGLDLFKPIHMEIQILIEVLEHSVKKNGADKPVTLGHLLNLVRLADKIEEKEADNDIYPYDS
jgi:hypothetical protein